jgi:hypothetical protein
MSTGQSNIGTGLLRLVGSLNFSQFFSSQVKIEVKIRVKIRVKIGVKIRYIGSGK